MDDILLLYHTLLLVYVIEKSYLCFIDRVSWNEFSITLCFYESFKIEKGLNIFILKLNVWKVQSFSIQHLSSIRVKIWWFFTSEETPISSIFEIHLWLFLSIYHFHLTQVWIYLFKNDFFFIICYIIIYYFLILY